METTSDRDLPSCRHCREPGRTVRSRGRIDLIAELCDGCWNRLANRMAMDEGATAPPWPDPDDVIFVEPPNCVRCGSRFRVYPTVYDRWVSLSLAELPAKDVPPHFRWRLVNVASPYAPVVIDVFAVRVRGIEPLLGEPVIPTHQMLCAGERAKQQSAEKSPDSDSNG
ncbi:DUF6083 domain-containing protein [Streptomyces sp. NPDC003343]